ncbi:hypothetical protein [Nocardioides deserti]|nr:hypothetical protein [Nocardioides deserti]GGO74746.1 hypothetical protein GCM10012276_23440 [Nocardioides deserti]
MSNTSERPTEAPRPDKRRRHLMDPNGPKPTHNPYLEDARMIRVQQWVMSSLAVTTILHLSVGLILAAMFLPNPSLASEIGLTIIAGAFGAIAVVAALAIHKKPLASWWVVAGFVVPTAVGLFLVLR